MSLLTVTLAFAIAPDAAPLATDVGIEPHRLQHVHRAEQIRQRDAAAVWEDFASVHGEGWQVQMDEANHTLRTLWGPGVPLSSTRPAGIALEVADRGIGIPEEQLEQVFQRFHQVDPSGTRRHAGTGIGLAICAKVAQLHGGRIELESAEGRGSTFRIYLALTPPERPSAQQWSASH